MRQNSCEIVSNVENIIAACVSPRGEAMPQRVLFRFRAPLLGRTPASHDVGRPGRCACLWHLIIKQGALFLLSHLHFLQVTRHHAHFRLVIHSTKLGTVFFSHTHSQHILFSTFSCLPGCACSRVCVCGCVCGCVRSNRWYCDFKRSSGSSDAWRR